MALVDDPGFDGFGEIGPDSPTYLRSRSMLADPWILQ
jgi:hypothetical protein